MTSKDITVKNDVLLPDILVEIVNLPSKNTLRAPLILRKIQISSLLSHRQTDRQTERQKDRKTERQKDRKTERQKDRKTERQTDKQTQTDRQTDRKNDVILYLVQTSPNQSKPVQTKRQRQRPTAMLTTLLKSKLIN
jgi:hypothetical protein